MEEGADYPAIYLSWDDVQAFIVTLNEAEGAEVWRLPTEAEWEYACRAGTTTKWSFGDDVELIEDYAWYRSNTWPREVFAHKVGSKLPNPWGLYDVHGNVWEWVQDWYRGYPAESQVDPQGEVEGVFRVARGGIYLSKPGGQRCAARDAGYAYYQDGGVGARLWYNAVSTAISPGGWGAIKDSVR